MFLTDINGNFYIDIMVQTRVLSTNAINFTNTGVNTWTVPVIVWIVVQILVAHAFLAFL